MADDIAAIISAIRWALDMSPPDLVADMIERGVITGGGALLKNLDRRICIETGLPVSIADAPQSSIVLGLGKTLSDFDLHRRMKAGNPLYSSDWEL